MAIRILLLVIVSTLSGCTTERLVRDNLVPDCPKSTGSATTRAAACMTAAAYEIAVRRSESTGENTDAEVGKDREADPRAGKRAQLSR